MKLFGSLTEVLAVLFRKNSQQITLRPNQSTTYTAARDFQLPPGDSDQSLASATSATVFTNKTFDADASGNSISNIENADIKAGAAIDAAKIHDGSVSNTEFGHLNGVASAILGKDDAGTFTNKTIAAGSNTITGLTKSDVGLGNVDNTSDATKNAAVAVLTNKTIDGDLNTLQDIALSSLKTDAGNPSKVIARDGSGAVVNGNPIPNASALLTTDSTSVITNKDIDGGTASNSSRFTTPKNTTSNLNALTRKAGTLLYDTDTSELKLDNGATLAALASSVAATPTVAGITTSYFPSIQSAVSVVTNNNATSTTSDGFLAYFFSTGNVARTFTLPAASSNAGRMLVVKKTDTGTGSVTVTRAGSDTIDSGTTFVLSKRFEYVELISDGVSSWNIVATNKSYTTQTFTSGSGTYTSPAGVAYIKVFCTGGGGGGGGDTTNGNAGSSSTFDTLTGGGGSGGIINSGGGGGTASNGDLNISGGGGMFGTTAASPAGGGGATFWGAGGRGCSSNATGSPPDSGTAYGSGGGGGGNVGNLRGGGGGGGTAIKTMAAGSYSYAVGSAGTGGSTGGAGPNGASGAAGVIYVEEFYS